MAGEIWVGSVSVGVVPDLRGFLTTNSARS